MTILWSGHDDEGNTVSGSIPVTVRDCVQHLAPAEYADGQDAGPRLTAWLMSLPPGSVADLGGLSYRVETKVKLDDRAGLTIRNGTLYRQVNDPATSTNFPNPFLWLLRPSGCTVEDLTFRGTNTTADVSNGGRAGFGSYLAQFELDAALRAEAFTDLNVRGLDVDGVWGDGIQLQKGRGADLTSCRIDRIGRQGVTVIASDVRADRVDVLHGRRSGFDFEPDSTGQIADNIEVSNSYTNTVGLAFASGGRGQVNNVWLHHNTSDGPSVPIVYVKASDGSRRSGWLVEDHTSMASLGSPQAAFLFSRVDGARVRRVNANIAATQGRLAVKFDTCGGVCEVIDSRWGSGSYYRNDSPLASQALTVAGNTPALTAVS